MSHFSWEEHLRGPDPAEHLPFLPAVKSVRVDPREVERLRKERDGAADVR